MRAPRVSVAMSVYNAGRFLRAALMSIVHQTFTDWELLLFDDGSTDGAFQANADLLDDSRIRVLRDGRRTGVAARLNEAIALAQGQYFARMDGDDVAYPERLARQLAALDAHLEWDLLGVRCVTMSMANDAIGMLPLVTTHAELCAAPWRGFYLAHPTWMGRTAWFRANRYAQPAPFCCEDQELLLRTYRHCTFACLPETLFAYRLRDGTPWRKSIRTRRTLLGLRFGCFITARDLPATLRALGNFVAGVCHDSLSQTRLGGAVMTRLSVRIGAVPEAEVARLRQVLALLEMPAPHRIRFGSTYEATT